MAEGSDFPFEKPRSPTKRIALAHTDFQTSTSTGVVGRYISISVSYSTVDKNGMAFTGSGALEKRCTETYINERANVIIGTQV